MIWTKHLFLKTIFGGLTLYLIHKEFQVFLTKPTFTSRTNEYLKPNLKPDIIICPQPGFDQKALAQHGYFNSFQYSMGLYVSGSKMWWNLNSKIGPIKLIEEISTIKRSSVYPVSWLKIKYENEFEYLYVNYTFTRTIHPYGRCLRIIMPERAKMEPSLDME
jgi:hypothetical protein